MKRIKNNLWIMILAIAMIVSAYLRFTNLGWETLEFDEIPLLYASQEFLKGNFLTFFGFDQPPMMKYLDMISLSFSGFSEIAIRFFPAIFGFGTVLLTYFFVRKLYRDERLAVLSTVLVAFSIIHIIMSRYAEIPVVMGFFYLLSLYFLHDYVETRKKRSAIYLGVVLALGMLSKYLMIYAVITIIVYAVFKKLISLKLKPDVTLSVDRGILKAFIIGIIVFLVLWPTFLMPLKVDMDVTIDNSRQRNVSLSLPSGILSFGDVASYGVLGDRKDFGSRSLPFIGSLVIFTVKESAIFIILFLIGLYFVVKKPRKQDQLLVIALVVYLLFLWLQNWGYTYRHLPPIIPIIAIISARWVTEVKKEWFALAATVIICIILIATAVSAYPDYPLHYNALNSIAGVNGLETHMSEGLRETKNYIEQNCKRLITDKANNYMLGFYFESGFVSYVDQPLPACVLIAPAYYLDTKVIDNFMTKSDCNLVKDVFVKGQKMTSIYSCV